jgi:hypothetical protein
MNTNAEWSRPNYEASLTSRCWAGTPYDAGWEGSVQYGEDLPASAELRAIFEEEMRLGDVPPWATGILDRMIGHVPTCGHYAFPRPLLQRCEAIGAQQCPPFVLGCYTADAGRKQLMSYCAFCMDAWLADAPLEAASAELAMRPDLGKDWPAICAAVYRTLGARSEPKSLAVERLIHRLRWWVKTLIWSDDRRDRFLPDAYLGDARGQSDVGDYGNPPFGDPYFLERRVPRIQAISQSIRETVPGGQRLLDRIESTWLCAPKAFRYVERILIEIGHIGAAGEPDYSTRVLQCQDACPDFAEARRWYASFAASLDAWLAGDAAAMPSLGESTPVKHWLAHILRHKLRLYERHNEMGDLVGSPLRARR